MVDVDFEEQNWQVTRPGDERKSESKMAKLILKTGLLKDPKQATYVLIGIAILFFALSIYFFMSAGG